MRPKHTAGKSSVMYQIVGPAFYSGADIFLAKRRR